MGKRSRVGFWGSCCSIIVLGLGGCPDAGTRPFGATCDDSTQCSSGLCFGGECVNPDGDLDGDGLTNKIEADLGSDGALADSDGDGSLDPDELDGLGLVDSDGDGKADIIESGTADDDHDCITNQYDVDDATPSDDVSPMVAAVCPTLGICGVQVAALGAACPDGKQALCVFSQVVGYANPEAACDGRDENCDGVVDEGFPAGCGVTAAPTAFTSLGSAAKTLATDRYRVTLVLDQPALGTVETATHRAHLGTNPSLAPLSLETP